MNNKIIDAIQQHASEPGPVLKAFNYVVAALGVSSFLGLVNLLIGVFSLGWLAIQLYGYIKYEIPTKRAKMLRAEFMARQASHQTQPGDLL